ncbi:phosphatase [Bacillota bacterium LX-D]|nr:phosphatase [Bacillota bacterium LX-D]
MKFVADLHTHSIASGHAYSTIREIAEAAKDNGMEMIAITDHGPTMPGAPHPYHFYNLSILPSEICGVQVLKGIEANIIDDQGNLDLEKEGLERLDIVLAGLHEICFPGGSVEFNTAAIVNAMASGWVDIIVHPGNPVFPVDINKVVEASKKYRVAIEINNSSLRGVRRGSYANCSKFASLAAEKGSKLVVGTDTHWAEDVGRFDKAAEILLQTGVKPEQVLNTSVEKVKSYLAERRKQR